MQRSAFFLQSFELAHVGLGHALSFRHALTMHGITRVVPQTLGHRRPFLAERLVFRAELFGGFLVLQIGRFRAGTCDHVGGHA